MTVDGTYKVDINSPMGTQSATLTLKADGSSLSGSSAGAQGTQDFDGGTVDGNDFAFSMSLSGPMGQIQLDFKGTVAGDDISGNVQLGSFGSASFKGSRT
ncbi:MAG: hypothetical protein V3S10_02535 [Dehalococcoidales bacterium]